VSLVDVVEVGPGTGTGSVNNASGRLCLGEPPEIPSLHELRSSGAERINGPGHFKIQPPFLSHSTNPFNIRISCTSKSRQSVM
jgi:hypothetical protein